MPRLDLQNFATLQNIKAFLERNDPFEDDGGDAVLRFDPRWTYAEPLVWAVVAAWGAWWRQQGRKIIVENIGRHANYAARMKLFEHLGVDYDSGLTEHEEAGRFLPVQQVKYREQIKGVIGDISALLHLQDEPDSLGAVQYCISELLRNVLEHSSSSDGAFVCAQRYNNPKRQSPCRVTIGVADCGQGIAAHLGQRYREAVNDDVIALGLAMQPGVTGAIPGPYGATNNAGAGLFFTRCIAKGTGGYFLLMSGNAAFRLRRARTDDEMLMLFADPYDEERYDRWTLPACWQGTFVSVEICTDAISDYENFFQWISRRIPRRTTKKERIRFT